MPRLCALAPLTWMLLALPCSQEPAIKELERFQGTWQIVKFKAADKALTSEFLASGKVTIKEDRLTLVVAGVKLVENRLQLDPSTSPPRIDMTPLEGPLKDKTSLGIYDLQGDTLRIMFSDPGKAAPKRMPKGTTGKGLIVLRKAS